MSQVGFVSKIQMFLVFRRPFSLLKVESRCRKKKPKILVDVCSYVSFCNKCIFSSTLIT